MTTTSITYRTGASKRDLRTVICEDVRTSVVLLPEGSLNVLIGKQVCGTTSACDIWAQELGNQSPHDFAVPVSQVVAQRAIVVGAKVKEHR